MPIPTDLQLLEVVKQFIEKAVVPNIQGRAAFEARVATNILSILMRQYQQENKTPQNKQELCTNIRLGAIDETTPNLLDNLLAQGLNQVAIDNPKYSTYRRLS
jgi:Domain of unknown function (DUF6285)